MRNESGFTLIETLVSGGLCSLLAGLIFPFCSFIGTAADEISSSQQLHTESTILGETFARNIRAGVGIALGQNVYDSRRDRDTNCITVQYRAERATYKIEGSYLIRENLSGSDTLSSNLDPKQRNLFRVERGGKGVELACSLAKTSAASERSYAGAGARARVRNVLVRDTNLFNSFDRLRYAAAPDPGVHNGGLTYRCPGGGR